MSLKLLYIDDNILSVRTFLNIVGLIKWKEAKRADKKKYLMELDVEKDVRYYYCPYDAKEKLGSNCEDYFLDYNIAFIDHRLETLQHEGVDEYTGIDFAEEIKKIAGYENLMLVMLSAHYKEGYTEDSKLGFVRFLDKSSENLEDEIRDIIVEAVEYNGNNYDDFYESRLVDIDKRLIRGDSKAIRKIRYEANKFIYGDASILIIEGSRGTGKTSLAQEIECLWAGKEFVPITENDIDHLLSDLSASKKSGCVFRVTGNAGCETIKKINENVHLLKSNRCKIILFALFCDLRANSDLQIIHMPELLSIRTDVGLILEAHSFDNKLKTWVQEKFSLSNTKNRMEYSWPGNVAELLEFCREFCAMERKTLQVFNTCWQNKINKP